jgi:hypothetical protein
MTESPNPDDRIDRFLKRLNRRVIKHIIRNSKKLQINRKKLRRIKGERKDEEPLD